MSIAARVSLFGHDPATYRAHSLHGEHRTYRETNCYADLLIELLHAGGFEPLAALGATVRTDFEGDQFTFFKPPPGEVELLFGVDIHEMQPYRPLPEQIAEQIEQGRTIIVELDSMWLPDTAATSYHQTHVKSSVAVEAIDLESERLWYYHGIGLHELSGTDFREVFRLDASAPGALPPYTEIVRFDPDRRLGDAELRATALELLARHLERRPGENPIRAFGERLEQDLPELLDGTVEAYHDYAFATARMAGSAYELCAAHVDWLLGDAGAASVAALQRIVDGTKALSFKLARRRPFDAAPIVDDLGTEWETAMSRLDASLA